MYVNMFVIFPTLYLMHFKSDSGVLGIIGNGLARTFRIWIKTKNKRKKNNLIPNKNKPKTIGLANFLATVTCWD